MNIKYRVAKYRQKAHQFPNRQQSFNSNIQTEVKDEYAYYKCNDIIKQASTIKDINSITNDKSNIKNKIQTKSTNDNDILVKSKPEEDSSLHQYSIHGGCAEFRNNGNKRRKNISASDKILLLNIVKQPQNRSVLTDKRTNAAVNQAKVNTWNRIMAAFNAKSSVTKTATQLKSVYNNELFQIRKQLAAKYRSLRGNGSNYFRPLSDSNSLLSFVQDTTNSIDTTNSDELSQDIHTSICDGAEGSDSNGSSILYVPNRIQHTEGTITNNTRVTNTESKILTTKNAVNSVKVINSSIQTVTIDKPVETNATVPKDDVPNDSKTNAGPSNLSLQKSNRGNRIKTSERARIRMFNSISRCAETRTECLKMVAAKQIECLDARILYFRAKQKQIEKNSKD